MTGLQLLPIRQQLGLMQFSPRLDKASLASGQLSRKQLHGVNAVDRLIILKAFALRPTLTLVRWGAKASP
ncbi:MAG TPA: hypothetical protein VJL59_05680 [Anaerolineales bacterium]|nr:hypothetical protein [Anaerolineales bacterium]